MSKELNKIMGMICERECMYYNASKVDALLAEKDKEIAELKGDNERLRGESCKLTDGCLRLKQCRKENANIADELSDTRRTLWNMTAEWADAMCLASCNIAAKFMSRDRFEVGEDYREKTIRKYRHRQVVFANYADYCRAKAENPQNPKARFKKPLQRDVVRGERLDEDCKRANTTVEFGKCLCYGLWDNAENTLDKCKKCRAYVWNNDDVNGIRKEGK